MWRIIFTRMVLCWNQDWPPPAMRIIKTVCPHLPIKWKQWWMVSWSKTVLKWRHGVNMCINLTIIVVPRDILTLPWIQCIAAQELISLTIILLTMLSLPTWTVMDNWKWLSSVWTRWMRRVSTLVLRMPRAMTFGISTQRIPRSLVWLMPTILTGKQVLQHCFGALIAVQIWWATCQQRWISLLTTGTKTVRQKWCFVVLTTWLCMAAMERLNFGRWETWVWTLAWIGLLRAKKMVRTWVDNNTHTLVPNSLFIWMAWQVKSIKWRTILWNVWNQEKAI